MEQSPANLPVLVLSNSGTGTGTGGMAVATAAVFRYLVEVKIND